MSFTIIKRLALINLLAIIGFILLYQSWSPRPFINLVYFTLMLAGGIYLARETNYRLLRPGKDIIGVTLTGIGIMLVTYFAMRWNWYFVSSHPALAAHVDTQQWPYFVKPWVEMNRFISVSGVILIVVALEYFYRAFHQEFFTRYFAPKNAILLTALLSGIRGAGGGTLAGPIDFLLALVWGWVYERAGLLPAILVHLAWDIPFVYFAPGY